MDAHGNHRLKAPLIDILKEIRALEISFGCLAKHCEIRLSSIRQQAEALEVELLKLEETAASGQGNASGAAAAEEDRQPIIRELLIQLLGQAGPDGETTKELERQVTILIPWVAYGTVRSTLSRLVNAGQVEHPDRGRWRLRREVTLEW
ncbi:hypothetical protein [Inquilinus sp. CAU 1745]|uniref:hypothetical protein n=1 Tax=Inquilinus sp. CAU 1745 TaxID=3140369 RepID=UPI00325A8263